MINRFYHYTCNTIEKEIYATILEGVMEYQEEIHIKSSAEINATTIGHIFKMVLYDNPRIFYTSTQDYKFIIYATEIILKPKYFFPLSSTLELQDWLQEKVEEIVAPVLNLEDAFAKEIYIHNYLIENVKYSHTAVAQPINAYTVAGTLLENNSVCAGIALSFKLLMDYLDIPCIVATGTAVANDRDAERHAWNVVCIDESYYQIDVTWDLIDDYAERLIKYDYFNLTSQEMYASHTADFEYPYCINWQYNYFFYTQSIVGSYREMISYVSAKVARREKRIYFKYTFDLIGMKKNINKYLGKIPFIGSYRYWINESVHTVFILR